MSTRFHPGRFEGREEPAALADQVGEIAGYRADLRSLIRFVAGRLGADATLLAVEDDEPGIRLIGSWGGSRALAMLGAGNGDGFLARAVSAEQPLIERLDDNGRSGTPDTRHVRASPIGHAVAAPFRTSDAVAGALCAGFGGFPPTHRASVLKAMSSYASVARLWLDDPTTLNGLLESMHRDGLTGCLTYTALLNALDYEVRRSERYRHRLSCCFIDLDGFKRVNDERGHEFGNRILVAVSEALRERVRSVDVVGRYGGDEFIVILPDTDSLSATLLADSLVAEIRAATALLIDPPVGSSFGVAEWTPGIRGNELLELADRALRAAKSRQGPSH